MKCKVINIVNKLNKLNKQLNLYTILTNSKEISRTQEYHSIVPDMHCVKMSSPIAMEVPSMVMNKIKYFSIWLLSSIDLIKDALLSRQFGTSSWQLDTSLSSTCWLGVKLTLAQRHMREYRAKVSPATIQFPL